MPAASPHISTVLEIMIPESFCTFPMTRDQNVQATIFKNLDLSCSNYTMGKWGRGQIMRIQQLMRSQETIGEKIQIMMQKWDNKREDERF